MNPKQRSAAKEPDVAAAAAADSAQSVNGSGGALSEQARRQGAAALRNSLAFTQIIGVLMRSEHYQHYALADLEWLVVPPMLAGQFRIGEAKAKTGAGIPVAVVLWASVSADVDKRLTEMGNAPTRLRPEEWTSGDILWLVHAAGEARFIRPVLKHLNDTTFKGRAVKIRGVGPDGKPVVRLLPTNEQAQSEALSRMAAGQPTLDGAIRQTSHANEMVAAK